MLDAEVLVHLPDEYKSRLTEYEKTFSTKGWAFIEEWAAKTAEEQRDRILFATTWEQYCNLQGRWFAYQELASLAKATYAEFEGLARQAQMEAIPEVELDME